MHVLIPVVSRFRQLTGICRHAINHAKAIADLPEVSAVTLVAGSWQQYYHEALANAPSKITVHTARCRPDSLSRNIWYARELPHLAIFLAGDIVHLSYPVPLRRPRFAVPVALTLHDLYPLDCPENFGFPGVLLNRRFLRQCVEEADAIACVSTTTRERLAHYFPAIPAGKPVVTIHSYSELDSETMVRPEFAHERFILTVGQHRSNKNHDVLLKAYRDLISRLPSAPPLVIVGARGPETPVLKKLADGLSGRVLFLEHVSDAELLWLYRHCEAFVAASSVEGFCLPLLEATQLSPRVICSDIPVFREISGSSCEFFSLQGSAVTNLSLALEHSCSNGHPRPPANPTRFSREATTRAYSSFYSQLLQATNTPICSQVTT